MNRQEHALLRETINAAAHHHPNAWWALKWQIFDSGYQPFYPAQGDFISAANRAVNALPADRKQALVQTWNSRCPPRVALPEAQILERYAATIVEVIVERARVAASRTIHW